MVAKRRVELDLRQSVQHKSIRKQMPILNCQRLIRYNIATNTLESREKVNILRSFKHSDKQIKCTSRATKRCYHLSKKQQQNK